MIRRTWIALAIFGMMASNACAIPGFTMVPLGIVGNNWVWRVDITPDLVLAGGSTPMAVEFGFRLTGSPLSTATNINPSQFDTPNPGSFIFGWETPDPSANNKPVGLQVHTSTNEVFAAFGTIDFTTPGAKPFLQIAALGPANGGTISSTIQWLGAYNLGNGRISQLTGPVTAVNYDIYSGSSTQSIPEPTSIALVAISAIGWSLGMMRRRPR